DPVEDGESRGWKVSFLEDGSEVEGQHAGESDWRQMDGGKGRDIADLQPRDGRGDRAGAALRRGDRGRGGAGGDENGARVGADAGDGPRATDVPLQGAPGGAY